MASRPSNAQNGNGTTLGFEQVLWKAADKLRSNMDAAEYKHVVLGLIFLKYISDAFEAHRERNRSKVSKLCRLEQGLPSLLQGVDHLKDIPGRSRRTVVVAPTMINSMLDEKELR